MIENLDSKLKKILSHFRIYVTIGQINEGPLITEIQALLEDGSQFSTVEKFLKDICREMEISGIRASEIPNSKYIRFEIPRPDPQTVNFLPITYTSEFLTTKYDLPICIGVDMLGKPVLKDLAKMPHLLVAGTTGSGKSVGLNSFILSLISKKSPEELQFVLIDPKRIEFGIYNNQKYMYRPVITDMNIASVCLKQLCDEMNNRYSIFEKNLVRNISEYHQKGEKMPYIICVIDEFADLIMFDKEVETYVQMLAQKSRAAGIHLIIATQRPSVDVITGSVKANLPTRLSYKVASPTDSMTILNTNGAEDLFGRGDSLFLEQNGTLTRILGVYVSNDDITQVISPYRCQIKDDILDRSVSERSNDIKNYKKEQEIEKEKNKSIWIKAYDAWKRIGRRNQTKIINFAVSIITSAISGKRKK